MENDECKPVSVSRRIEAPADEIFKLLANPDSHPEFDGSGMLRTGAKQQRHRWRRGRLRHEDVLHDNGRLRNA